MKSKVKLILWTQKPLKMFMCVAMCAIYNKKCQSELSEKNALKRRQFLYDWFFVEIAQLISSDRNAQNHILQDASARKWKFLTVPGTAGKSCNTINSYYSYVFNQVRFLFSFLKIY